jgi:hypothetical protein
VLGWLAFEAAVGVDTGEAAAEARSIGAACVVGFGGGRLRKKALILSCKAARMRMHGVNLAAAGSVRV